MRKTNTGKVSKEMKESKTDNVVVHQEPRHADDDTFTAASFPFVELIPNWHKFDVNCKNPAISSNFNRPHHGGSGSKKMKDFTSFHLACCLEFVTLKVRGIEHRVRCMNVFTVDSNQCVTHTKTTYKDGPNKIYTLMKRNETANWGMIKDTGCLSNDIDENREDWKIAEGIRSSTVAKLEAAIKDGRDAIGVWSGENARAMELLRIQSKDESDTAGGKVVPTNQQPDALPDLASMRRAYLDKKAKGNVSKRTGMGMKDIIRLTMQNARAEKSSSRLV